MAVTVGTEYLTTGQRWLGRSNAALLKTRDISSSIIMIQPNGSPFYSMTAKFGAKPSKQMKFEHAEDDVIQPSTATTAAYTTDTIIAVTTGTGAKIRPNAILRDNTTGEQMRVITNNGNDTVTVSRAFNGVGGTAIASGEILYIVQESFEEGVKFSDAISREAFLAFNYLQEMEVPVSMSNLQMITEDYTTADWDWQTQKAMRTYKEQRERTFWAGNRYQGSGQGGHTVWYTGGMDEFIQSGGYVKQITGVLTKKQIDLAVANIAQFGDPNQIMAFGAPLAWSQINAIADGFETINRNENTLGLTIQKFRVNGRVVNFVENQQFVKMGWTNRLYFINMGNVRKRYLATNKGSLNTQWRRNVQEPDRKGRKDVVYGVEGIQRENVQAHGLVWGFNVT